MMSMTMTITFNESPFPDSVKLDRSLSWTNGPQLREEDDRKEYCMVQIADNCIALVGGIKYNRNTNRWEEANDILIYHIDTQDWHIGPELV